MTEHEGWKVWEFGGTDWIAARSFEEAVAFEARQMGATEGYARGDAEPEPCNLATVHYREACNRESGKCSFLDSLKEILAEAAQHGAQPDKAFILSSTEG